MTCEEIMRKALLNVKTELAALLEDPNRYEASRWPVSNAADAAVCAALDDVTQPIQRLSDPMPPQPRPWFENFN